MYGKLTLVCYPHKMQYKKTNPHIINKYVKKSIILNLSITSNHKRKHNKYTFLNNIYATTHLNNIWIFLLFITILGEIIIALGNTIIHHPFFRFNSLINDDTMEFVTPCCKNGLSFKYAEFINIFDNEDKVSSKISEIEFVLGEVFAGLGYISLTMIFYFSWKYNHCNFIPYFFILVLIVVVLFFVYTKKVTNKGIINFCAMAISIIISVIIGYFLAKIPIKNPFYIDNLYYIYIIFLILVTIFLFYYAMLRYSFANRINCAIINSP